MNIHKFYEEEWISRRNQKFEDYPRNEALREFFPYVDSKVKVLDLACGNRIVSEFLVSRGYDVSAIDISSEAIKQVKKRGITKSYVGVGNVEERLPFGSSMFDIVFWGDNIEHLILPAQVLYEIKRVLKKGGRLIVSTPNMGFLLFRWHYLKTGQIPRTEGIFSEPWEWKHIRFFNKHLRYKLLTKIGFKPKHCVGAGLTGIYKILERISPALFSTVLVVEAIKR